MHMNKYPDIASRIFISHYDFPRPCDWRSVFKNPDALHVEIGFGQGEFLIRSVKDNPNIARIGIERDWGRTVKCFKKISRLSDQEIDAFQRSLKILHIDAWVLFERYMRPKTVDRIECLFPCPWPKDCHEKHRLFSRDFFRLINSRLKDCGTAHMVTDDWCYADWVTQQSEGAGFKISKNIVSAKFDTKFERKWVEGGQEKFCELFFTKTRFMETPLKKDIALKAYYHKNFNPQKFSLPEEVHQKIAIISKEWLYDEQQFKGMLRVVVSEEHLTQHMWIVIIKTRKGWGVLRSEGQQILPTPGTARALEIVSEAVRKTAAQ